MKRIVHVVGLMNRAGAETMIMNLYRKLDRKEYQFDFIYFTEEECDYDNEIIELGGRIFRISEKNSRNPIIRTFFVYKLIKRESPFYAIQCHQLFSNSFHLVAAFFAGVKMRIAHSHNTSDVNSESFLGRIYQRFAKIIMSRFATHFIACGENAGKFLFPGNDKVVFLPNAIDVNKFMIEEDGVKRTLLDEHKIGKNTIVISQIGRFSPVKNHEFTLNFAKYLNDNEVDFHLMLVGDGFLKNDLKKLRNDLSLEKKVTFLGIRQDIENILSNSDIMIMPSFYEGFPVVLVESQAAGVPALISESISSEVDLGIDLVHFSSLDASFEEWYNKLKIILKEKRVSVKQRRDVLAKKGFDINSSVKILEKFYEK